MKKSIIKKFTILDVYKHHLRLKHGGQVIYLKIDSKLVRTFYPGQVLKIARPI